MPEAERFNIVDTMSSRHPLISVVIPVFNAQETIGRALDSAQRQSFSDFEIIVVDDGCKDQTADVVLQSVDDRLRLVKHGSNRGAAAARNSGIAAARGRWIAFLDSDDVWKPNKLAYQIKLLEGAGPNVLACASGYNLHKDGRELQFNFKFDPEQFRREILFGCRISPGSTLVVERRAFDEIGGFDESLRRLEDWDWLLRFARQREIVFLPEALTDIYETRPRRQEIDKIECALDHIARKHLSSLPALARRQLRGSLLIEKAAMLYRGGRPFPAIAYVLAGLSVYPFRDLAFFRTLWRSVVPGRSSA